MKCVLLINLKLLTIANSFLLNIAEHEHFSAYKNDLINPAARTTETSLPLNTERRRTELTMMAHEFVVR